MKRIYRNILCIFLILLGAGIIVGTIIVAKNNLSNNTGNQNVNGSAPSMPSGDNSSMGQPPTKPSDDNSNSSDSSKSNENNSSMPTPPTSDNSGTNNNMTPPSMPNSNNSQSNQFELIDKSSVPTLSIGYIIAIACGGIIFSISLLYLLFSLFGAKGVFVSGERIIIFILASVIVSALVSYGTIYYTNNNVLLQNSANQQRQMNNDSNNVSANGKKTISSDESIKGNLSSSESDQNTVLVKDGASATIENANIEKSGDSTNTESADFYGTNAAVLTQKSSTTTIKNTTITTNAKGANAVFATGENAKVYISDSTIKTTGSSSSRGLDATYGGYIEGKNLKITTQG